MGRLRAIMRKIGNNQSRRDTIPSSSFIGMPEMRQVASVGPDPQRCGTVCCRNSGPWDRIAAAASRRVDETSFGVHCRTMLRMPHASPFSERDTGNASGTPRNWEGKRIGRGARRVGEASEWEPSRPALGARDWECSGDANRSGLDSPFPVTPGVRYSLRRTRIPRTNRILVCPCSPSRSVVEPRFSGRTGHTLHRDRGRLMGHDQGGHEQPVDHQRDEGEQGVRCRAHGSGRYFAGRAFPRDVPGGPERTVRK